MDKNLKSSVIGFWRSGASVEEVCGVTGLYYSVIMNIIKDYKNQIA